MTIFFSRHCTLIVALAWLVPFSGPAAQADDKPPKSLTDVQSAAAPPCDCGDAATDADAQAPRDNELRVAADPNNLPFTNERKEGFENQLAELVSRELGKELVYEWRAQRRGFFRQTLKEGDVDLVLGVPSRFEMALPTQPYYRSSYVFVSRSDRGLKIASFDDPRLRELRIGVQMIGDDGANTPPAHALAARGIIRNVVGFTLYGDYTQENPPARIIDAVVAGDVDIAVVWGPLAGFYAKRHETELTLVPVPPKDEKTGLPFAFSISMGVKRGNTALRDRLNEIIERRRGDIEQILDDDGVPRLPLETASTSTDDDRRESDGK